MTKRNIIRGEDGKRVVGKPNRYDPAGIDQDAASAMATLLPQGSEEEFRLEGIRRTAYSSPAAYDRAVKRAERYERRNPGRRPPGHLRDRLTIHRTLEAARAQAFPPKKEGLVAKAKRAVKKAVGA